MFFYVSPLWRSRSFETLAVAFHLLLESCYKLLLEICYKLRGLWHQDRLLGVIATEVLSHTCPAKVSARRHRLGMATPGLMIRLRQLASGMS